MHKIFNFKNVYFRTFNFKEKEKLFGFLICKIFQTSEEKSDFLGLFEFYKLKITTLRNTLKKTVLKNIFPFLESGKTFRSVPLL